ncbi:MULTISPECIES: HD domain-containing protein [unclassified Mucilaginibacter]|uniref:HD domain-containing protein n=1 Tax=unclassified Mucilaginibacter TaxID=2617802 RepID=UPI002AC90D02|nr:MULTISPECIES: HD domain-containing protein [unclassified Mucilaginibacter]MEB0260447.1 HD domain-containing protein [Mucilaginibacter sp. 10I4]MEB0280028.1 HD domain-containing protein [Mucilaginibacter sp. 10B2]MEB0301334.1 HD domain-containing protein [Mucilaginibacter sp. 5C4]WPX23630.1 HD domain-containing protein [Mucilaginibacter sp. 5C4]
MTTPPIIQKTVTFVQDTLKNAEGGHDWWHIQRVWTNAKHIANTEDCDLLTVELAALLHDIADSKFHNGNEEIGPATAGKFLQSINVDEDVVIHVQQIIRHMSFKASFDKTTFHSKELAIVQDADRLDAIGAIGIARAFTYGGFKDREIYNPEIKPNLTMSKEEYKNTKAPTINHFYEKLLLLKDKMNTETGKQMALQRHNFMETFLEQFYTEVQ